MDLTDRTPIVEETARKLGLYLEDSQVMQIPGPDGVDQVLVVNFTVGAVAWRVRTQDEEQAEFDRQAAEMEAAMVTDEFLDLRNRMAANREAGRDLLDEDDDGSDEG